MKEIDIIEIMNSFNSSNIFELNLDNQNFKLYLKKKNEELTLIDLKESENSRLAIDTIKEKDNDFIKIKSPQVGKIVSINHMINRGDGLKKTELKKGEVLCIIEAMKMMNEVVVPIDGTIKSIMIEENQIVEYGQVLFEMQER